MILTAATDIYLASSPLILIFHTAAHQISLWSLGTGTDGSIGLERVRVLELELFVNLEFPPPGSIEG